MIAENVICRNCQNNCSDEDEFCPKCHLRLKTRKPIESRDTESDKITTSNRIESLRKQYIENLVSNTPSIPNSPSIIDKNEIAELNYKGKALMNEKKFSEALNCFLKAQDLSRQLNDQLLIGVSTFNVGEVKIYQGKLDEGIVNYKNSLSIFEQLGDKDLASHAFVSIGIVKMTQKKNKEALEMLQNGLKMLEGNYDIKRKLNIYYNIGSAQYDLGKIQESLISYETALTIATSLHNTEVMRRTENIMTQIRKKHGLSKMPRGVEKNSKLSKNMFEKVSEMNLENHAHLQSESFNFDDFNKTSGNNSDNNNFQHKPSVPEDKGISTEDHSQSYWQLPKYVNKKEDGISTMELNQKRQESIKMLGLGLTYYQTGNYQEGFDQLNKAMKLAEEIDDDETLIRILYNIGTVNQNLNKFEDAMENYKKGITIAEKLGDLKGKLLLLESMGSVCLKENKIQEAFNYYNTVLPLSDQLKEYTTKARVLDNIAFSMNQQKRYMEAQDYGKKAVEVYDLLGDPKGKANALNGIALTLVNQLKFFEAIDYYERSLPLFDLFNGLAEKVNCLKNIALLYTSFSRFPQGFKRLEEALIIAKRLQNPVLIKDIEKQISEAKERMKTMERINKMNKR